MWVDLWVGRELALTLESVRAVKGVEIEFWAPDQLDGDQVLDVDINGQRWQHHVRRGARSQASFPIRCAAGSRIDLRINAERSFVPSRLGGSGDDRELAWRLLGITVSH